MKWAFIVLGIIGLMGCEQHSNAPADQKLIPTPPREEKGSYEKAGEPSVLWSPVHENLSHRYNFQTKIVRLPRAQLSDSCLISIHIFDKSGLALPSIIQYSSDFLLGKSSFGNTNVRSYQTGWHEWEPILDGDFGDLVIADFNFDGLEDIAAKREEGGNGGPLYAFFLQSPRQIWEFSPYLSDSVCFFPEVFEPETMTFCNNVRTGAYRVTMSTYQYIPTQKNWQMIGVTHWGE